VSRDPNPFDDEELMAGYHEVFEMDQDNSIFRNCLVKKIDQFPVTIAPIHEPQ